MRIEKDAQMTGVGKWALRVIGAWFIVSIPTLTLIGRDIQETKIYMKTFVDRLDLQRERIEALEKLGIENRTNIQALQARESRK